jgi:uncharacterized delta-60 repeat protein
MKQQPHPALLMALLSLAGIVASAHAQQLDVIEFSSAYYSALENSGSAVIELQRSGGMSDYASLEVRTEATGLAGTNDFRAISRTVTFAPGESNLTVTVEILNDGLVEGDEAFYIVLSDPDPFCCQLGLARARVLIIDNDRGVGFSSSALWVPENHPQPVIQLQRGGDLVATECLFVITNIDGTATDGIDYSLGARTFTFAAGQSNLNVPVFILNDILREEQEHFQLQIVDNPFGCPGGSLGAVTIFIMDNDPGVEFVQASYAAVETNSVVTVHLQRFGDAMGDFTVDVVVGGSATPGADFILPTNRLHFASGQTNLALILPLLDDPLVESDEFVDLYLTNATGGVPLGWQAICKLTLYDNEYASQRGDFSLWLSSRKLSVLEDGTNTHLTIVRGGNSSSAVSVDFITASEATPGVDFLPAAGTVIFEPLETTKDIRFQILNDCRIETNEAVQITLINATPGVALSDPERATLVIVDDEAPGSLGGFNPALAPPAAPFPYYYVSYVAGEVSYYWEYAPPEIPSAGTAMALQMDGKIVVGRSGSIARLNKDGSYDSSFLHGASICASLLHSPQSFCGLRSGPSYEGGGCAVYSIVIQPDGTILAGGHGSVIRLHPSGSLENVLQRTQVYISFAWTVDLGGHGCSGVWNGFVPSDVTSVVLEPDGSVLALGAPGALQADGKLVVAAQSVHRIADGRLDTNFASISLNAGGQVRALAILGDHRILIAGDFTSVDNQARQCLARLYPDGLLDTNFNPVIIVEGLLLTAAYAVTIGKDGSILVAGQFPDGTTRVVKLDSEGLLIPTFNSGLRFSAAFSYPVISSIIEQPDGEVLVAGTFDNVNGIPRPGIARLKSERSHIHLSPPLLQADGLLRIVTGSHVGSTYVLQSSSDLIAWTDLSTNIAKDCTLAFEDPNPASTGFYRVVKID